MEQPIRVLHVEDERDFADVTASFLEQEDDRITVRIETRATDGLDALSDADFDCILSDYDMPGMNGIEFLEAIREEYPDLPFILYTGKGSEEIASEAISAGVTDYLQKKVGTDQYAVLANRIANAAGSYRTQRSLDERNRELRRYERMVNSMLESACIYDKDGRFEIVNEYLADWYGTTPVELEGEQSNLIPLVRAQFEGDPYQALLDGKREEVTGRVEDDFPGYGHAVLEYRLTPLWVEGSIEGVVGVTREVTERQSKARRLETLIQNLPGIVYRCRNEPGWPMEFVRGECEDLTGYSAEAIESHDVVWGEDIVHPEDRESVWETIQDALAADQPFEFTYRIQTADGETKWVWERGRRSSSPGEIPLIEGFITEVTERKRRKQDLERTNALLSTLFDTLPQGVLAESDSRDILTANQRFFDLFEVEASPEDVIGTDCRRTAGEVADLFADPAGFVDRIDELVEARSPVDDEELTLADGRTFERSYRPIALPDGDGHLWVYRDVTGRKERQRALETVFDQMDDAVLVHPPDGSFTFVNQAAIERYGFEEAELLSMTPQELDHPDSSELVPQRIRQITQDEHFVFETEHRTASGETIPVEVNATLITFRGDAAVLSIARDITGRKKRERELERQNRRLDQFASVVSHDLRNPLNVATLRTELAREEADSEHLEAIDTALDRMERIVDDVLVLARKGEDIGATEPVDLATSARDAWEMIEDDDAELRLPDATVTIEADQTRLRQLLENLFRNSTEHGSDDYTGVTVTVGTVEGGFYVADDGPGIPPDERERVFETGYSTRDDGTGFGLSIVRQVAKAHGWTVEVTDSEDGGARFEVSGVDVERG